MRWVVYAEYKSWSIASARMGQIRKSKQVRGLPLEFRTRIADPDPNREDRPIYLICRWTEGPTGSVLDNFTRGIAVSPDVEYDVGTYAFDGVEMWRFMPEILDKGTHAWAKVVEFETESGLVPKSKLLWHTSKERERLAQLRVVWIPNQEADNDE